MNGEQPSKKSKQPRTVNDLMKAAKKKTVPDPMEDEEASSAVENEEGNVLPEEEDDFLASDGEETEAAAKNAQMALSRILDVDIDGGWKEGTP